MGKREGDGIAKEVQIWVTLSTKTCQRAPDEGMMALTPVVIFSATLNMSKKIHPEMGKNTSVLFHMSSSTVHKKAGIEKNIQTLHFYRPLDCV